VASTLVVLIPHIKLHLTQRYAGATRTTVPAAVTVRLCARRHAHASGCRAA
jgi:hypothetical protein